MSGQDQSGRIRRVVIGFDPSGEAEFLVRAATEIAETLQAEIKGVFVEERALFDFAALPFAQVIGSTGRKVRTVDMQSMEVEVRQRAVLCRKMLSKYAGQAHVQWSFGQIRGVLDEALSTDAEGGDVIALGLSESSADALEEMLGLVRRATAQAAGALLVSRAVILPGSGGVAVIHDGDEGADEALRLGARIAERRGLPLTIIAVDGEGEGTGARDERLDELVQGTVVRRTRHMRTSLPDLVQTVREAAANLLIADVESDWLADRAIARGVIASVSGPTMLIRLR